MPKPLLKSNVQSYSANLLSAVQDQGQKQKTQKLDKMKLDRLLRKSRSKEYMEAIQKLDAGGHVHNQEVVNQLLDAVRDEFPEIEMKGVMLGIVAKCYLGRPYEVHILDMANQILQHFKTGESLPYGLEKARSIAMRGGYAFIEVYTDCCRAVGSNGSVSVIPF